LPALDLKSLHTNQRLFVEELMRRGASVYPYDTALEILLVSYNGTSVWLVDRSTHHVPLTATILAADKQVCRDILAAHGVPVPKGGVYRLEQQADILKAARETLAYPLVLKPHQGSHGHNVYCGIENEAQLENLLDICASNSSFPDPVIVEEHIEGREYRIFVTSKGDYAVLHRDPAHVIGDGVTSIEDLAEKETVRRLALKREKGTSLCPIVIDAETESYLARDGKTLGYVPSDGEKVYLRHASNLVQGGFSRDCTDEAHPSVIALARRALACFPGLPLAGVDFMTTDISADQSRLRAAIIEVNTNPGFSMHMLPGAGTPRNVAAYAADVLFPDL